MSTYLNFELLYRVGRFRQFCGFPTFFAKFLYFTGENAAN